MCRCGQWGETSDAKGKNKDKAAQQRDNDDVEDGLSSNRERAMLSDLAVSECVRRLSRKMVKGIEGVQGICNGRLRLDGRFTLYSLLTISMPRCARYKCVM